MELKLRQADEETTLASQDRTDKLLVSIFEATSHLGVDALPSAWEEPFRRYTSNGYWLQHFATLLRRISLAKQKEVKDRETGGLEKESQQLFKVYLSLH